MKLPLKKIRLDGGTQTRARVNEPMLTEYAQEMKGGAVFPPLVVFYDGTDYWLADGFHRWGAAESIKLDAIECEVRSGTMEDAQWFSYSANKTNGMRRSNDDKARAVKAALKHCGGLKSNAEIARHVGVSREMVSDHRDRLQAAGEIASPAHHAESARAAVSECVPVAPGESARVVTRKGKTYQMKTGKIGKAKKPRAAKLAKNHFKAMKLREDLPANVGQIKADAVTVELPTNHVGNCAYALYHTFVWSYLEQVINQIHALKAKDQKGKNQ